MTLTVELSPELVAWLRDEAHRRGLTPEELLARDAEVRWATARRNPRFSATESELIQTIGAGLPEDLWRRYRQLIAVRDQEALTEAERAELIELSDRVETATLQRTEALVRLAELQGTSVPDLVEALGLRPVSVAP